MKSQLLMLRRNIQEQQLTQTCMYVCIGWFSPAHSTSPSYLYNPCGAYLNGWGGWELKLFMWIKAWARNLPHCWQWWWQTISCIIYGSDMHNEVNKENERIEKDVGWKC